MTLTISLTPEEEARLLAIARQRGIAPQECARQLITDHLPEATPNGMSQDPTLVLFAQWKQEDAQKSPDEAEDEERMWEEFERGVNETRTALGMRQL
jgi:hypothetical protein